MELVQSMKLGGGRKCLIVLQVVWTRSTDLIGWGGYLIVIRYPINLSRARGIVSSFFQQPRVLYSRKTITSISQLQHHFPNHFALPDPLNRVVGAFKRMHRIDDIVEVNPGG